MPSSAQQQQHPSVEPIHDDDDPAHVGTGGGATAPPYTGYSWTLLRRICILDPSSTSNNTSSTSKKHDTAAVAVRGDRFFGDG